MRQGLLTCAGALQFWRDGNEMANFDGSALLAPVAGEKIGDEAAMAFSGRVRNRKRDLGDHENVSRLAGTRRSFIAARKSAS